MYQPPIKVRDLIAMLEKIPGNATIYVARRDGSLGHLDSIKELHSDPTGGKLGISGLVFEPYELPEDSPARNPGTQRLLAETRY